MGSFDIRNKLKSMKEDLAAFALELPGDKVIAELTTMVEVVETKFKEGNTPLSEISLALNNIIKAFKNKQKAELQNMFKAQMDKLMSRTNSEEIDDLVKGIDEDFPVAE